MTDEEKSPRICSVCGALLKFYEEDYICNFCYAYDSYAYKHAVNKEND